MKSAELEKEGHEGVLAIWGLRGVGVKVAVVLRKKALGRESVPDWV